VVTEDPNYLDVTRERRKTSWLMVVVPGRNVQVIIECPLRISIDFKEIASAELTCLCVIALL
jgi:hypothetical protein